MASTDARPVPLKNTAYRYYYPLRLTTGALVSTATGMDTEVSKDGGTFTDTAAEWTEIGTTGCGYIDLTATEMNADAVVVKTTFTNTNNMTFVDTLYPQEVGDIVVQTDLFRRQNTAQAGANFSITLDAAATSVHVQDGDLVLIVGGTGVGQINMIAIGGWNNTTKVATVVNQWATNPTSSSVFQIWKGDSNVAAAITDVWADSRNPTRYLTSPQNITSDDSKIPVVSGHVTSNTKRINDTTVKGDGTTANPWGPV